MKTLDQLIRPNILGLKPYSTARDDFKGDGSEIDVFLDANESPFDNGVNRYPDPRQRQLKMKVGQIKKISSDQIFIGNGSDEAIDLVYRIFCRPGVDNVVSIAPTYGMYGVTAEINDVELREVQLNPDFSLPSDRLLAAADANTKVIWLCSPNNPTGNAFAIREVTSLARDFGGMVVVDEAYIDFSDKGSMVSMINELPNVIVLQTMSKAHGMAAVRVGLAFASADIIRYMDMVKYPYNVNQLSQQYALDNYGEVTEEVALIKSERTRLAETLKGVGCVEMVYPSDANFLLVRVDDADIWYDRLLAAGVIVRNRSHVRGCEGCLRITVGTPEENDRVISRLIMNN